MQLCSIAPVMLTVCCRVIGDYGRLSGAAVSATLVSRTGGSALFCRTSAERDAVFLMLTRVLMATRHSKASMACPHTLEEMIPTLCGVPARGFDVVGEARHLNGYLSKQGLNLYAEMHMWSAHIIV